MGYIYKITNKINNKIYIGLTTKTIQERFQTHIATAYNINSKDYNELIKKAIRKYGKENFTIEQIDEAEELNTLKEKEIYWINKYQSYAFEYPENGYNMTRGGDFSSESLQRPVYQIDILSGKILQEFNSIAEAERISGAGDINSVLKKGYGQQPHNSGTTWVYKEEYYLYKPENYYDMYGVICQLDSNGKLLQYWLGPVQASKKLGINQSNISSCLTKNRNSAGGFQWCYFKNLNDKLNKPIKNTRTYNKKPVIQLDLIGNFVKEWESASEAARQLNIQSSKITAVCLKHRKTTGGFKWRYK